MSPKLDLDIEVFYASYPEKSTKNTWVVLVFSNNVSLFTYKNADYNNVIENLISFLKGHISVKGELS